MSLTAKQLRAAAAASRELASEYAEGVGPHLRVFSWCGCAAAEVLKRAGIASEGTEPLDATLHTMAYDFDLRVLDPAFTLSRATEMQFVDGVPGALVFPLLWAADELENAAKGRPQKELHP